MEKYVHLYICLLFLALLSCGKPQEEFVPIRPIPVKKAKMPTLHHSIVKNKIDTLVNDSVKAVIKPVEKKPDIRYLRKTFNIHRRPYITVLEPDNQS